MKNTKKIVILTLAIFLVSVVITGVSITPSVASGTGSCTLSYREGRTIVHFGSMIRSDRSFDDAHSSAKNVSLDAGSYRVTLVSYDNHSGKGGQNQPNEAYRINFLNSNGNIIEKSASMQDLPDNIDTLTQVVNSSLRISQDVYSVVAEHSAYRDSNPNSIVPVCAAFDRLDDAGGDEPDVQTLSATGIDGDSAELNGEANPNREDTDVWFEWGTSGFNLNRTTNRQSIGDGTSFVDFDERISGLNDDTRYYFRAVAENDEGIEKGSIRSFRTDADTNDEAEPDVTTLSARNIENDEARLRGQVRPNDLDTDVWFEWGTSRFNLNEDTNRQDVDGDESLESFDYIIDDLDEDEKYYFRAVAENSEGIDRGSVFSFTTDDNGRGDDRPDIRDVDVENIDDDSARLVCTVDANGNTTSVWFEWDENEDDVDDGDGERTRKVSVSRSHTRRDVKITIIGLDDDTRYFFRCIARNSEGTDESRVEDFRTDDRRGGSRRDEPDVTTRSATDIGQTSALLRGEADPNGEDTDVWFQWGTSRSNLSNSSRIEDIGDGTREKDFDRQITGLRVNTTYYFRAVAENREGIDRGSILTFRTGTLIVGLPTIITRIVEVIREIRSEPEIEGLIITLETNTTNINRGELVYEISYDNRTDDTFTDAELIIEFPNELEFVDASPREDNVRGDTVSFEIGTIRPGDNETFVVEAEVGRRVDDRDDIVFSASVSYIDDDDKKIVTVIDITRISDTRGGGFAAFFAGSLGALFTNPFLWLIILLVVIFFVYRYFASLAKPKEEVVLLDNALQPPLPQE